MIRRKRIGLLLSIVYATLIIVGHSFMMKESFQSIENNLLITIILYSFLILFFYKIVNKLFKMLDSKKRKKIQLKKFKKTKFYLLFSQKTFLFSFVWIIISWLPYLFAFYPAILSPDPSFQIKQYFQIPNKYSTYSIMLDPKVTITNHHPVIHTLLLGTCVKIGEEIGEVNIGLFLYSVIQIIVFASVLAYTIHFLKERRINDFYLLIMLLVYSIVPIYPFYSISAVKDVMFASFTVLYIIEIYRWMKRQEITRKQEIKIFIIIVLVILFRNNGIHTILLSFPLLLFLKKKLKYKLKILMMLVLILGFYFSYHSILLPAFKITPSSVRETLSIPFQQTARYVKEHSDEIGEEERKVIDKVLDYDTLSSRYQYNNADPVKNKFNKYATKEDLKKYFSVWFKQFKKHPKTYIEATISNTYGYYYPFKTNWYIYYKFDKRITENGFNYHYNHLKSLRNILINYGLIFPYLLPFNIFINIGFNGWILLFMGSYFIYKKKYQELIYLAPSFVLFFVCIASPVNSYFRYALPYVFAFMLNFGIFLKESN